MVNVRAFWIKFAARTAACVEAVDIETAISMAEDITDKSVTAAFPLPYPANPRIGPESSSPAFCYRPDECSRICAVRKSSSCPQARSCTD